MTKESTTICGYKYVCLKAYKGGRYTQGKVYFCNRSGWLTDNNHNLWSIDEQVLKEHFIEEDLLWKIIRNIPFELILKIKLEPILKITASEEAIQNIIQKFFNNMTGTLSNGFADIEVEAYELGFKGCQQVMPKWKHWKDGIAGNGDGRQIYLTRQNGIYNVSSCLGCECDYIELSELDKL